MPYKKKGKIQQVPPPRLVPQWTYVGGMNLLVCRRVNSVSRQANHPPPPNRLDSETSPTKVLRENSVQLTILTTDFRKITNLSKQTIET